MTDNEIPRDGSSPSLGEQVAKYEILNNSIFRYAINGHVSPLGNTLGTFMNQRDPYVHPK